MEKKDRLEDARPGGGGPKNRREPRTSPGTGKRGANLKKAAAQSGTASAETGTKKVKEERLERVKVRLEEGKKGSSEGRTPEKRVPAVLERIRNVRASLKEQRALRWLARRRWATMGVYVAAVLIVSVLYWNNALQPDQGRRLEELRNAAESPGNPGETGVTAGAPAPVTPEGGAGTETVNEKAGPASAAGTAGPGAGAGGGAVAAPKVSALSGSTTGGTKAEGSGPTKQAVAREQASSAGPGNSAPIWPAGGPVAVPYGMVKSSTLGDWRYHDGIDITLADGTPVVAVWDGKVVEANLAGELGWTVVLEHDGKRRTVYASLGKLEVKPGERVLQGQVLGRAGDSALLEVADGIHVHFELREGGSSRDPLQVLPPRP